MIFKKKAEAACLFLLLLWIAPIVSAESFLGSPNGNDDATVPTPEKYLLDSKSILKSDWSLQVFPETSKEGSKFSDLPQTQTTKPLSSEDVLKKSSNFKISYQGILSGSPAKHLGLAGVFHLEQTGKGLERTLKGRADWQALPNGLISIEAGNDKDGNFAALAGKYTLNRFLFSAKIKSTEDTQVSQTAITYSQKVFSLTLSHTMKTREQLLGLRAVTQVGKMDFRAEANFQKCSKMKTEIFLDLASHMTVSDTLSFSTIVEHRTEDTFGIVQVDLRW
ncbi:MAG TPA: hypothetical protein VFM02_01550 [Candidatus Paceibacterota bacterium]|nr:hypothetical protein [Candidatus Paceibacterota bacterium]